MALKKTSMCNSSNALLVLLFLVSSLACSVTASVSYDSKAITINGQRRILISGSIHYPRSSPEVFSQMHFMFFVLLLLLKLFLQMGTSKCAPGLCPLVLIWLGFFFCGDMADVARSYSEGKRRRTGCYSDICFLEWAWTFTRKGNCKKKEQPLFFLVIFKLMEQGE